MGACRGSGGQATPKISDYYRRRLDQIDVEIRQQQRLASLPEDSAITRRKARQARKRLEELHSQYEQIERLALEDAKSGIGF